MEEESRIMVIDVPTQQILTNFWQQRKLKFINLQLWEEEREFKLARHKALLDLILSRILFKANIGKETSLAATKYLKERAQTEIEFAGRLREHLVYLPSPESQADPLLLQSGLAKISALQKNLADKMENFGFQVENELVKDQMARPLIDYDAKIADFQGKVDALKGQLELLRQKTAKTYKEHCKTFRLLEQQITNQVITTACSWLSETRYYNSFYEEMQLHHAFANYLKLLWKEVVELETARVKSVKAVLEKYLALHRDNFAVETEVAEEALIAVSEDLSETFSSSKFITQSETEALVELGCNPDDPLNELVKWKVVPPDKMDLIAFEGEIQRETSVFRDWKPCYGVLTKDKILHIFHDKTKSSDPIVSIVLVEAKLMVSNNSEDPYFEIIEKQRGGFIKKLTAPRRTMLKAEPISYLQKWLQNIQSLSQ